jgi:hypothetical protein
MLVLFILFIGVWFYGAKRCMSAIAKLGGIGLMRKYLGYSAGKCDEWWDER